MHVPRRLWGRLGAACAAALMFPLIPAAPTQAAESEEAENPLVLIFTKTTQFRHTEAIVQGTPVLQAAFQAEGIDSVHTEDSTVFNDAELAKYDALVMFQTSGDPWNAEQKAALERYQRAGGGIVAIHNATDMRGNYAWWDTMIGALMPGHAATGNSPGLPGTVRVEDQVHPSTKHLPQRWNRADEWYNYSANVRGEAHVLATMDETTYEPGSNRMGYDHPISWCRPYDGGRAWMTGMGHFGAHYQEPALVRHILGGVKWAAGLEEGDCGGTDWSEFEKVALDENTSAPFAMDVAPDGRVFFTELVRGQIRVYNPTSRTTSTAVTIPVYSGGEDGLLGIALDPKFAENGYLYVYYAPASSDDTNPANWFSRLSRFTVGPNSQIDRATEKVLLTVPASRLPDEPGHTGGGLDFDAQGNLYLGVGDDVNPHSEPSGGYAPLSERPNTFHDARATSANTNDLRGKVLRIKPEPDGTYSIPQGNMFAPGTPKTKPEIYAMGFRNPFRFSIDQKTGALGVADYSPDNNTDNLANRGPAGIAEYNLVKEPGFYGWPLCMGNNEPFRDVDYTTSPVTVGGFFNCNAPINDSVKNTGLTELPAAKPATMWYGYQRSSVQGGINQGGGLAPMGGPFYQYDPELDSDTKFPQYYEGKPFFYDWARNRMFSLVLKDGQTGIEKANPFLPNEQFLAPIDSKFGPDGSLYVLDWGGGYGRDNPNSGLHRIDYISGSRSPVAEAAATPDSGHAPLVVQFDGSASKDPEGAALTYAWDFDGNGTTDATTPTATHTYTANGVYDARLTVTDPEGKDGTTTVPITVGNTRPQVTFNLPPNGGFFDFGDQVSWDVEVTDAEDTQIADADIVIQPALGHDEHAHPSEPLSGRKGTATTSLGGGHGEGMNVFYVLDARYTDKGGAGGVPALTGSATTLLFPKQREAEFYSSASATGITTADARDVEGHGSAISGQNGAWAAYDPVSLRGVDSLLLRVAAPTAGTVELRRGAADGPVLGRASVPATGGLTSYVDVPVQVTDPGQSFSLYVVFPGAGERRLNFIEAVGKGVSATTKPVVSVTAPAAGAELEVGPVQVTADATDAENTITKVEFFVDGQSIGSDTTAPYAVTWNVPKEARYRLTAVATNDKGVSTTSRIVIAQVGDLFAGWETFTNAGATFDRPDGDRWIINSGGTNMWQAVDQYGAAYRPAGADDKWTATVKIERQGNSNNSAKAGIIVRNNIAAPGSSPGYAALGMRPSGGFEWLRDTDGNGQLDASSSASSTSYPVWVRLTRDGANYQAYWSKDGTTFTAIGGPVQLAGAAAVQDIGLFVTAHHASAKSEVEFSGFTLVDGTPQPDPGPTPLPSCVTPGSDEFVGSTLDAARWPTVRQATGFPVTVADGSLRLPVTQGDINEASTGPISYVGQPAPAGDWEATTRLTLAHNREWQHAGLMLHASDNEYVKLAYTRNGSGGRFLEFQTETGGTRTWHANNVAISAGDTVHLRLKKAGSQITASYSVDGATWTALSGAAPVKANATLGVMAAGDTGTPNSTALFDWFRLSSDATGPVVPSDEFTGSALDGCRWNASVRGDARNLSVAGGELRIVTQPGDINGAANEGPRNVILQKAPQGNWTIETRLRATMAHQWQLAGLLAYGDDDNYVKLDLVANNASTAATNLGAELVSERNAQFGNGGNRSVDVPESTESGWFHLRLTKTGSSYQGWVSTTGGLTWTALGQPVTNDGTLDKIGLMAIGPQQVTPVTVAFDFFRLVTDSTAPTVTAAVSPAAPNGANGWYTSPVSVTLTGADNEGGSGVASVQYRMQGAAAWSTYSAPVALGADGTHTVEYRATDQAGNVSAVGSTTVTVDATKPAVAVTGVAHGSGYGDSTSATVAWTASDATSGVASTTATLDGKAIASGTTVTFHELALGEHTLVVTSTDNAGNVTAHTVTFTVTTSLADIDALIGQFVEDGTISAKTAANLRERLVKAVLAADMGSEERVISHLQQFADRVNNQVKGDLRDLMVRQLLRRDAEALIADYQEMEADETAS
ncbi:ThuA domain-containing protein [Motilibacter aurantiacus]|uniref:ThuA domain-containing protein n=1 Tax=Motilibacter aurantiacus TaxID=2714955 RepID=UPI00140986D6|nr:ThuA domain-containing protein [Motilibacter aurantiacus]NHC46244.1 DUF1349 domain-containing protein [Motilibacter aurantiacus]